MKQILFLFNACWLLLTAHAQQMTIEAYVQTYKTYAIEEMIRSGVPASITLAQGILETEHGTSRLATKANNHFGIKCKENWTGPTIRHDDDAPGECFRVYDNALESYKDHSDFLRTRKHYAFLFQLDPLDYKAWAHGLKKAGYATNPKYPEILIRYIETYRLQDYSLIAMGKKPQQESLVSGSDNEIKHKASNTAAQNSTSNLQQKEVIQASKPVQKKQYPDGIFEINRTKVVYAKTGTPWLLLAETYNINLHYLFDFNDQEEQEVLEKDQLVYLQRKRKTGDAETHQVQDGETLYDIAQIEGIRMESILMLNQLQKGEEPATGEVLYLREKAPSTPRLTNHNESKSSPAQGGK